MMSEEFGKDVGLVSEVVVTGRKVGAGRPFWAKLAHDQDFFASVVSAASGFSEVRPIEHLIDLDADPFVPDGWSVDKGGHKRGGKWRFDPKELKLYLSKKQKRGVIGGNELRKEIAKLNSFNANLLDWLLRPENQKFIPEDWKNKAVFFWGTIYRDSDGDLCVRYLYWNGGRWGWGCDWLGNSWDAGGPAAVRM